MANLLHAKISPTTEKSDAAIFLRDISLHFKVVAMNKSPVLVQLHELVDFFLYVE